MAILPLQLARVSNQLRTSLATNQISRVQQQMLEVQNQLSTGHRVNSPSDDPGSAAIIQQLQKTLENRQAYAQNLKQAQSNLGEVDTTLGDLSDLLQQAQTIASANVGSDVTSDARESAAALVDTIYSQAMSLANKQFDGVYLFGGDKSTIAPFQNDAGGATFVGSTSVLQNVYDDGTVMPFMVNGEQVFGALSSRATGATNLSPNVSLSTRLDDLAGATGDGIRRGSIQISNGPVTKLVDLSSADTIGDVVDLINSAGVGGITAGLNPTGTGLSLNAGAGDDITVIDPGGGTLASDLGIARATGLGAGANLDGVSTAAKVTSLTPLADLRGGAGLDLTGFTITNGASTATIDLTGVTTVEGLLNAINGSNTGVRASINDAGTGIDIFNASQGTEMRIAENGGTTAAELGVRTFSPTDALAGLNNGKGVTLATGDDLSITRQDGTTFTVDLNGAVTVQDAINAINTADAGGGVTASFATTGNGIVLTDTSVGGGTLTVGNINGSTAADDLGLTTTAAGGVITGTDVNPVSVTGVFANLRKLADGLRANDARSITAAAEGLKEDYDRTGRVRGQTGAQVQELESRASRLDDQNVATKGLLSSIQDTDFTTAISQFQQLQNTMQASLQTTANILNLSLLDYLK